jgi:hypothetical protein
MTFAISLVTERSHGTLVRLRVAPVSLGQMLLRCAILLAVGFVAFTAGVRLLNRGEC